MGLGERLRLAVEKLRAGKLDEAAVKEAVKELQRALIAADVEVSLVLKLSKHIEGEAFAPLPKGVTRREHVVKVTYDALADLLGGGAAVPEDPKRILLVGLFGSGKTTSCGKLAKWYAKRGKRVGVIAADVQRPAAFEQLQQVASKAGVKFFGDRGNKDAADVVKKGLAALEKERTNLVIVDSAGRSGLDAELSAELKKVHAVLEPEETWLVMGADLGQIAKKQAQAFHETVGVNGVILTRMDGSAKGGGALAACGVTGTRVHFIGTGEKLDDLEAFDAKRYLGRLMGYGDLEGLLEKMREVELGEIDVEKVVGGEFDLEMFYQQLTATRQMGNLDKVMDWVGLKAKLPREAVEIGEKKLDQFRFVIDSMTSQEKKNPDLLSRSRVERIAKGSGRKVEEVRELLAHYKKMRKAFKGFKGLTEKVDEKSLGKMMAKLQGGKRKRKKFRLK